MTATKNLVVKGKGKNSLINGFADVFKSFGFVMNHNGVIKYYVIPFFLNIAVLAAILYFAYTGILPWMEQWLQHFVAGDAWYMKVGSWLVSGFISYVIKPLFMALLAFITVYIYSIVGGIIISPFLDFLSEKVEVLEGGESFDEPFSVSAMTADIVRALKNVLKLIIFLIIVNVFLVLLNLIPVVGSFIYIAVNFFLTCFFYGFQFYDYPLERRRYTFGEKFRICWRHKLSVAGNGGAFFILSLIPVVGFLGFNSGTIGAALTFTRDIKPALAER